MRVKFFSVSYDNISTYYIGLFEYEWLITKNKHGLLLTNQTTGHTIKAFNPFLFECNTQIKPVHLSSIFLCGNACGFLPYFVYRLNPILKAQGLVP